MRKLNPKEFLIILKKTFNSWNAHDPFRQSAVVAYYAIFSLPGLLVVVTTVAGFFFGTDAVHGTISRQITDTMGSETANQVNEMVRRSSELKKSIIATIIGIAILLFGATGVFAELQKSLNIIWGVKAKKDTSLMKMIRDRLFSFGLVLSIGFLLIISLIVSSALTALSDWLKIIMSDFAVYLLFVLHFIISMALFSGLFSMMFRFLPDARIKWRHVWPGAILTSLLFLLGKFLLALYFGKAEPASAYGAAGSIVLILLWVSYSCMILFFGGEFTLQHTRRDKEEIIPTSRAEKVAEECEV
jgi:membrane protein